MASPTCPASGSADVRRRRRAARGRTPGGSPGRPGRSRPRSGRSPRSPRPSSRRAGRPRRGRAGPAGTGAPRPRRACAVPPARPAGPAVPAPRRSCRHLGGRRATAEQEQVGVLEGRFRAAAPRRGRDPDVAVPPRARAPGGAGAGSGASASHTRPVAVATRSETRPSSRIRPPSRTIDALAERRHVLGLVGGRAGRSSVRPAAESTCRRRDPLLGVEARGGLVEQQQLRVAEQRLGQADAAPLAAGERADPLARPRRRGPTRSSTRRTSSWRGARSVHSLSTAM